MEYSTLILPDSGISAYVSCELTFGEQNELDDIMNGEKSVDMRNPAISMSEMPYLTLKKFIAKVMMITVKKLIGKDGVEIPVNVQTLNGLSAADGSYLQTEVINLFGQKKSN